MDLRSLLLSGHYETVTKNYRQEEIRYELSEMMYHDLAAKALEAADALGYTDLARTAARIVDNSGSYGQKARDLARKYIT